MLMIKKSKKNYIMQKKKSVFVLKSHLFFQKSESLYNKNCNKNAVFLVLKNEKICL